MFNPSFFNHPELNFIRHFEPNRYESIYNDVPDLKANLKFAKEYFVFRQDKENCSSGKGKVTVVIRLEGKVIRVHLPESMPHENVMAYISPFAMDFERNAISREANRAVV